MLKAAEIRKHAIDPHRIGDVLDLAIPERLVSADQFVLYLFENAARDVNLAGIGNTLEARSNIDAVTVNVVSVSTMTSPRLTPIRYSIQVMGRQRGVTTDQILLNNDAAPDSFNGAVENRNKAVAGGFDEFAVDAL